MLPTRAWMAGLLLGAAASLSTQAAAVDEQALHSLLVERVDVRKWGTAIVVGISSPQGRQVASYGTLALNAATNAGVDDTGRHVLDPRVTIARAHPRVAVAANVLEWYVGRYLFDDGVFMTVAREKDHLVVQMTGQGPSEVFASGPREFHPEDIEAQFVFAESGNAPAQSLMLNQDGQSYKAVRVAEEATKK